MSRTARKRSSSGIYHLMLRGNNKQEIFEKDDDTIVFLRILSEVKMTHPFRLYACCFMGNHIHLLIAELPSGASISVFMRLIISKYVMWYNKQYNRIGNLFQDRFLSEPVEDITYFKTAFRYIHQNPLKGGLENRMGQYRWSSYGVYLLLSNDREFPSSSMTFHCIDDWMTDGKSLIDYDFPIMAFENIKQLTEFCSQESNELCLDIDYIGSRELSDDRAKRLIAEVCHCESVTEFQALPKYEKKKYIRILLEHDLSQAQIRRLCGVSAYMIRIEAEKMRES